MAQLTPLTLEDAQRLGGSFGLSVVSIELLLEGSVNTNARLEIAGSGRHFLRIYEEQTLETAQHEAGLLQMLANAGVPTPRPLPRVDGSGGAIAAHRGKPVAIFPFIEGEVLCQARVRPTHTRAVGAALARVHEAGRLARGAGGATGATTGSGRFGPEALLARLEALPSGLAPDVETARRHLSADHRARLAAPPAAGEVGLVHGDLFRDNVLFAGEAVAALLDFESAFQGSLAFDLAVTVLAWCYGDDLDAELARALLDGYLEVRPVDAATRGAIFDEGLRACERFATTRITDFELRPRGTGVYKDFRRWLARQDAVRRLGEAGLRAALFG